MSPPEPDSDGAHTHNRLEPTGREFTVVFTDDYDRDTHVASRVYLGQAGPFVAIWDEGTDPEVERHDRVVHERFIKRIVKGEL